MAKWWRTVKLTICKIQHCRSAIICLLERHFPWIGLSKNPAWVIKWSVFLLALLANSFTSIPVPDDVTMSITWGILITSVCSAIPAAYMCHERASQYNGDELNQAKCNTNTCIADHHLERKHVFKLCGCNGNHGNRLVVGSENHAFESQPSSQPLTPGQMNELVSPFNKFGFDEFS